MQVWKCEVYRNKAGSEGPVDLERSKHRYDCVLRARLSELIGPMKQKSESSPAREVWVDLERRIRERLIEFGFAKRAGGYWKTSADESAFAGVIFGPAPGQSTKDRIDITFRMLGGLREFHEITFHVREVPFTPSQAAAQFSAHMDEDGRERVWTLTPLTNVEEVFADILFRLSSEALPKIDAMLDRTMLLKSLKAFEVNTADGALDYFDAIRMLSSRRISKAGAK